MWTDLRVLRNFQTGLSSEAMSAIDAVDGSSTGT
jgi:hypothetical protein